MRASGYEREVNDWYQEPRWSIDALLDVEDFQGVSWDPSCGGGNIPEAMKARGLKCLASDIADRGYGIELDFFACHPSLIFQCDNIVTNPPYGVIQDYIERSLLLANNKVAVLARLALLESTKRKEFFATTPLARVWVSSRRISMPPGGTDVKATGGTVAYAWFVWEHGYTGKPVIGWI